MTSPRLIVNADDFGLSRGISDGILVAHQRGILTSTSIMVNQPAAEYALELLRQIPSLGIGIHLNLCAGRPVLPPRAVPSLISSAGSFHARGVLFRKLWRFDISAAEIEAEFRAQIRWLKDRGVSPAHADSHMHIHIYPAAIGPFIRALTHEGIRYVRAPRCSVWPADGVAGGPHEGSLPRRLLVRGYRSALQFVALHDLAMPHSRVSFRASDRRDISSIGPSWLAMLDHLPPDTFELACHPGVFEPGFSESDRIAAQREVELRWLTSGRIREAIRRRNIQLIRYADLASTAAEKPRAAEVGIA